MGRLHFQLNITPIIVKLKNLAIHGEFTLLTVTDGGKLGLNPINIRGVVVDFVEMYLVRYRHYQVTSATEVCTGKSDNALTPGRKVFLEL